MTAIFSLIKAIAILLGLIEPPNMEPIPFDKRGVIENIAPTSFPID